MPASKRRIDPSLIDRLRTEPHRFEFFQAVRLLLGHYRDCSNDQQDLDILGQVIQFRNSVSLGFPPSEIEALHFETPVHTAGVPEPGTVNRLGKVVLTPAFIGLTGPMGVMPRHYTHYVAEREIYHRDTATRAFLDIFSSRAVALFYQTWLKYRLHLQYEADRKNRFLPLVLSLGGFGLAGTQQRLKQGKQGIADESLAYYVSAMRERPQSVQWFARVIADYFRVKCQVEQFVGQWLQLPHQETTRLGTANHALGQSTFCGGRVWDRNAKIKLIIGPLRKQQFDDFLPGKHAASNLKRFFQLMVGLTYDCEVQLILDKRDLVQAKLDSRCPSSRLGWNGWLGNQKIASDSDDVAYLISAGSCN